MTRGPIRWVPSYELLTPGTHFTNNSWPAEYLIDANSQILHVVIGEGDNASTRVRRPVPAPACRTRHPTISSRRRPTSDRPRAQYYGGTGTLTATVDGRTTTFQIHGAPNIYTVYDGTTTVVKPIVFTMSPGLSVYSFTFG